MKEYHNLGYLTAVIYYDVAQHALKMKYSVFSIQYSVYFFHRYPTG
jgi:hypothetical protein